MVSNIVVYTDGAARGNPGPSASGFAIFENGKRIKEDFRFDGIRTNNQAEYNAIIGALEWCAERFPSSNIKIYSDSELVVRQIKNEYKVRTKALLPMKARAAGLLSKFSSVEFHNLPREEKGIAYVDRGLNKLLDKLGKGKSPAEK